MLEADIEDFFGSVDLARLREILQQRVQDGVLLRLIGKWLQAGVMEEGRVYRPETGVPQGWEPRESDLPGPPDKAHPPAKRFRTLTAWSRRARLRCRVSTC